MVEEFITRMFELRNATQLAHWKTKSYSAHQALGAFYDEAVDSLDKYIEAHQGALGLIGEVPGEVENASKSIHDNIIWLTKNREKIAQNVPALENLLDELTSLHMATLYKLENLR